MVTRCKGLCTVVVVLSDSFPFIKGHNSWRMTSKMTLQEQRLGVKNREAWEERDMITVCKRYIKGCYKQNIYVTSLGMEDGQMT